MPCLTIAWARLAALDPWGRIAEARRARGCILPREPNPSALLDLARAGVLWTGTQHENRHRPLNPRAVRWQERSGFRRLETTMDRDDDLTAQWDTDRARAGDALAKMIRERDEARAALAAERAAVGAWLRRPVTEGEARALFAGAARIKGPSQYIRDFADTGWVCWNRDGTRGHRAADTEIAPGRFAIADAIERGEHLTGGEGGR